MTIPFATIRQKVSQIMQDWLEIETTSAGAGGGTTAVSTDVATIYDNDYFSDNPWFGLVTNKLNLGEIREFSDFVSSSGTLTVPTAFSNQVASGTTMELHKYHPDDYKLAINRARNYVAPRLHIPIVDESLVFGSWLENGDFEDNIRGEWGTVNDPEWEYDTLDKWNGRRSLRVIAGSSVGQVVQNIHLNYKGLTGDTIKLGFFCRAVAGSTVRVGFDWDGSSTDYSDYHTGVDEWQLLTKEIAVPSSATQIKVILEVAGSGMGWFDGGYMVTDNKRRYKIPERFYRIPSWVGIARDKEQPTYGYDGHPWCQFEQDGSDKWIVFNENGLPQKEARIQLKGRGHFPEFVNEGDLLEIEEPYLTALEDIAVAELCDILAGPGGRGFGDQTDFLGTGQRSRAKGLAHLQSIRLYKPPAMVFGSRWW
jgi:hypothetical protein